MFRSGYNKNFLFLLCSSLLLALLTPRAGAQNGGSGAITIEKGGTLWIAGSASITNYKCSAEELSGQGTIENIKQPTENIQGHGGVTIAVRIPVQSLDCGKRAMNNDMYESLKADRHPTIYYQLLEASLVQPFSSPDSTGWMNIQTRGILEIAGVRDTTQVTVKGTLLSNNRFRVWGSKELDMKTFDITPPSAFFGLIKADNKLTVNFDVTVRMNTRSPLKEQLEGL